MKQFEYDISVHPAESFREIVYFCSAEGECNLEDIASDQIERLQKILNERGRQGWEIVQVAVGKGGVLVFWKRMIND